MPKINQEVACVNNPDVVCPARQLLINNYRIDYTDMDEEEVAESVAMQFAYAEDDEDTIGFPFISDEAKLQVKLVEQRYWAEYYGCDGPTGNVCPPRVEMNNNTTRSLGVTAFRKVRALFKK